MKDKIKYDDAYKDKVFWYNGFWEGKRKWMLVKYLCDTATNACIVQFRQTKMVATKIELLQFEECTSGNLIDLKSVNEPNILSNLRERMNQGHSFTFVGDVLIKLHNSSIANGAQLNTITNEYTLAKRTHMRMEFENHSQTILVFGHDSTGKIESAHRIVEFLIQSNTTLHTKFNAISRIIKEIAIAESSTQIRTVGCLLSNIRVTYNPDWTPHGLKLSGKIIDTQPLSRFEERKFGIFNYFLRNASKHSLEEFGLSEVSVRSYNKHKSNDSGKMASWLRKRVRSTSSAVAVSQSGKGDDSGGSGKQHNDHRHHRTSRSSDVVDAAAAQASRDLLLEEALDIIGIPHEIVYRYLAIIIHLQLLEFGIGSNGALRIVSNGFEKHQPNISPEAFEMMSPGSYSGFIDSQLLKFGLMQENSCDESDDQSSEHRFPNISSANITWAAYLLGVETWTLADIFLAESSVSGAQQRCDSFVHVLYQSFLEYIVSHFNSTMENDTPTENDMLFLQVSHSTSIIDSSIIEPFSTFINNAIHQAWEQELYEHQFLGKTILQGTTNDASSRLNFVMSSIGLIKEIFGLKTDDEEMFCERLQKYFYVDRERHTFTVNHGENSVDYSVGSLFETLGYYNFNWFESLNVVDELASFQKISHNILDYSRVSISTYLTDIEQIYREILKCSNHMCILRCLDANVCTVIESNKSSGDRVAVDDQKRMDADIALQMKYLDPVTLVSRMKSKLFLTHVSIPEFTGRYLGKVVTQADLHNPTCSIARDILYSLDIPLTAYMIGCTEKTLHISLESLERFQLINEATHADRMRKYRVTRWWRARIRAVQVSLQLIRSLEAIRRRSRASITIAKNVRYFLHVKHNQRERVAATQIVKAWRNYVACRAYKKRYREMKQGLLVSRNKEWVRVMAEFSQKEQEAEPDYLSFAYSSTNSIPMSFSQANWTEESSSNMGTDWLISWRDLNLW